jgi:hypothetical protein
MKSIDHYLAMVPDQEAARDTFLKLGFNVRPTAAHIELGSSNAVVIFPNSYLELLYCENAKAVLKDLYYSRFDAGPGLAHVSLTAASLAEERARITAMGYTAGLEGNARRKVILPDGREGETDSSFLYNWHENERFMSLFFSEHRIPDMIFIEGHTHHPNGAQDLAGITSVSRDPDALLDYYRDSWEGEPEWCDSRGFGMRGFRGDFMNVLTAAAVRDQFAGVDLSSALDIGPVGGFPVALHFGVTDLAATGAYLSQAGVTAHSIAQGLVVPPSEAENLMIVFQ